MKWETSVSKSVTRLLIAPALALLAGCSLYSGASEPVAPWNDPGLDRITRNQIESLGSANSFERYLAAVDRLAMQRNYYWACRSWGPGSDAVPVVPNDGLCDAFDSGPGPLLQEVVVTGSRINAATITNVQEAGVDEGDIVKRIGRFLIVLQNGRLYSIDIGDSSEDLRVIDRINIYRSPDDDIWYDEILVHDRKVVVIAYDYGSDLTDISVFDLHENGVLEWLTGYQISSQDYFSTENYAARLIDGHLLIQTTLKVAELARMDEVLFPVYRQQFSDGSSSFWQPLIEPDDIVWPILPTLRPAVHSLSVCSLLEAEDFDCRTRAFVGPSPTEVYVTPDYAYIWNAQELRELEDVHGSDWVEGCGPGRLHQPYEPVQSVLYRIPVSDGPMSAMRTGGFLPNQFALAEREDGLHMLVDWNPNDCWAGENGVRLRYARVDHTKFSARLESDAGIEWTDLPTFHPPRGRYYMRNRFSENHLTFANSAMGQVPADYDAFVPRELVVMPLDAPNETMRVELPHSVHRLETLGSGLIAVGYNDDDGTYLTSVSLEPVPRVTDREFVANAYETDSRSHAFNHRLDAEGNGILGLPFTTTYELFELSDEGRLYDYFIYRRYSDISFFNVDSGMNLSAAGSLTSSDTSYISSEDYFDDEDSDCEVSCVNWYGHARPFFIGDRIFALTGRELIEGQQVSGNVQEIGRVNLTEPPSHSREP